MVHRVPLTAPPPGRPAGGPIHADEDEPLSDTPGPCPKCGSADTKATPVKPPRKHPGRVIPCDPECTVTARLCLNCRLVTSLPAAPAPRPVTWLITTAP